MRFAGRSVLTCALLVPLGLAALVAALVGQGAAAARWWRRLDGGESLSRPRAVAVAGHAVASVLLGVAALPALGTLLLSVLRGLFYGLVDQGPYDNAWGGPTRAGAWVAHFLISIPLAAAGVAVLIGVAAVHRRLTRSLDGERLAWWVVPVTVVLGLLAVLLIVGWTRQI